MKKHKTAKSRPKSNEETPLTQKEIDDFNKAHPTEVIHLQNNLPALEFIHRQLFDAPMSNGHSQFIVRLAFQFALTQPEALCEWILKVSRYATAEDLEPYEYAAALVKTTPEYEGEAWRGADGESGT